MLVSEYLTNIDNIYRFKAEHLIEAEDGFFLSASYIYTPEDESTFDEYRAEKQEVLMYFSTIYDITAETDDNGMIEVVSKASSGDLITFSVSPRIGYRLNSLTVTSQSGEKVTFTEDDLILNNDGTVSVSVNSFSMPSSNVFISALFEKIPENPNTIDNILFYVGMFISSLGIIIGLVVYRKKRS